jgi:glycosyltransferase involved in cell wall biosynthesis
MAAAQPNPARTSFVIASRNRAGELAATINRLLVTTNCPIILVDNHSEDYSVGTARRIEAQSANRLQITELDSNWGAVGRNVGVAACRTPFVAFCDDDSWWASDATAIAEEIFRQASDRRPCWPPRPRCGRSAETTRWPTSWPTARSGAAWTCRGALHDGEHARGAAQALMKLPAVVGQRRRLPASVEQTLALLESG